MSKGSNQGSNQGSNRMITVATSCKSINSSMLAVSDVWLTAKECCNLLGKSGQAIRKACKAEKYTTRLVQGNGGLQYQILLQSLGDSAVKRWEKLQLERVDLEVGRSDEALVPGVDEVDVLDLDELQRLYCESPDYNRKKYEKYYPFFMDAGYFSTRSLPTYSRLVEMIDVWNANPEHQKLTYKSVVRVEKELREHGYRAFFGSYGQSAGVHLSFSKIDDSAVANHLYQTFRTNYLKASAPTIQTCYRLVQLEAKRVGADVSKLPSATSFDRAVKSELVRKFGVSPASALYRARFGADAWARKFGNYCDRDDDGLLAGNTWVFDHMQLDLMVKTPDGSVRRFWLTGICDLKSWKLLYYSLNVAAPCTDDIKLAYIGAVSMYGAPERVYLDNGKDFRSKDFSGQTKKVRVAYSELFLRSVLGMTGVEEIKFAIPYNAKVKVIERLFRKMHDNFERVIGDGYTGSTPTARTKELAEVIKRKDVLSYEELIFCLDHFVQWMNDQPMQRKRTELSGLSPNEVFQKFGEQRPAVDAEVLYRIAGRMSSMRQVGRNGFEDSEVSKNRGYRAIYWGDWMLAWQGNGERVYARRDLDSPDVAFFYSEQDHRYLGAGYLDYFRTMTIAGSSEESARVSQAIGSIQGHNRRVAAAIKPNGGTTGRDILTAAAGESLQLITGEVRVPKQKQIAKRTGTDDVSNAPWKRALNDSCITDDEREEYERTFGR